MSKLSYMTRGSRLRRSLARSLRRSPTRSNYEDGAEQRSATYISEIEINPTSFYNGLHCSSEIWIAR